MATSELGGRGGVVTLGSQPRTLGSVGRAAVDMWSLPTRAFSNFDWPRHDPLAQGADLYSLLGFESPFVQHALTPAEQVANDSAQLLESRLAKKLGEGKVYFLPQGDRSYFTRVIDEYPKTFGEQTKGVVSPNTLHSLSIIPVVDPTLSQGNNLDALRGWVQKQVPTGSSVKPDFTQLGQAHEEKGKRNHMIVVETPVDVEAGGKGKGKSVDMIVILPSATVEASEVLVDAFLTEDVEKAQQRAKEAEQAVAAANGLKLVEEERRATAEANATVRDLRLPRLRQIYGKHGKPRPALLRGTTVTVNYPDQTVRQTVFPGQWNETKARPSKRRVFGWKETRLTEDQQAAFGDAIKRYQDAEMIKHPMKHVPLETVALEGAFEQGRIGRWVGHRDAEGTQTTYTNHRNGTYTEARRTTDGQRTEETHHGHVSGKNRRLEIPGLRRFVRPRLKTYDLSVTRPISNPLPVVPQEK